MSDEPVISEPAESSPAASLATSSTLPSAVARVEAGCAAGYESWGDRRLDVLRLGALCGPSNGLVAKAGPAEVGLRKSSDRPVALALAAGDCAWVMGSAAPGALEVQWLRGDEVIETCELPGLGMCPIQGPICAQSAGDFQIVLTSGDESAFAFAVWER